MPATGTGARGATRWRALEGHHHPLRRDGLQHVVDRVHVEGADRVLVEGRHEDDGHVAAEQLQHLEAVELGHLHVEEQQVGGEVVHGLHRLEAVAALAYDLDATGTGQVLAQQRARRLLVVHDHDAQRPARRGRGKLPGRGGRGSLRGLHCRGETPPSFPEVRQELGRAGVAVVGGLREAAVEHALHDGPRGPERRLGQARGRLLQNGVERLDAGLTAEGRFPRQHLVEQRAEGEEVAARVHVAPPHLLGRHVGGGAKDAPGVRVAPRRRVGSALEGRSRTQQLGEAEVDDLGVSRLGEHHVLRLQVAVNDAARVRLDQALGHLDREVERAGGLDRGARDRGGERPAAHQLHGDEGRSLGLVDLVDHRDGGVRERGSRARFLLEPSLLLGLAHGGGAEHLERDLPAQRRVEGAVDDADPAPADLLEHLVVRKRLADHSC